MKNLLKLCVPVFCVFLISCDKEEDPILEAGIVHITYLENQFLSDSQDVEITLQKPSNCHEITETEINIEEGSVDYNFIMVSEAENCIMVESQEKVKVKFEPASAGEYSLNFFINGKFFETRTVTVAE